MADIKGIELASDIYGLEDETARDNVETNTSAIGTLANLETTAKTNLVEAINEVNEKVDTLLVDRYSTSEVKTNKLWIDGKPIYRKVVSGIIPSAIDATGWASVDIVIPNFNKVISLKFADCEYKSINGMAEYVSDDGFQFKCFLYRDYIIVKTNVNSALSSSFNLIVEYTKTTD